MTNASATARHISCCSGRCSPPGICAVILSSPATASSPAWRASSADPGEPKTSSSSRSSGSGSDSPSSPPCTRSCPRATTPREHEVRSTPRPPPLDQAPVLGPLSRTGRRAAIRPPLLVKSTSLYPCPGADHLERQRAARRRGRAPACPERAAVMWWRRRVQGVAEVHGDVARLRGERDDGCLSASRALGNREVPDASPGSSGAARCPRWRHRAGSPR